MAWLGDASCTDCPRLLSPRLCPGVPSQTGPSTGTTVSGSASEGSHLKVLPWISASSVQNEEEATSSLGEPEESTGGDASRHAKPSPLWLGSGLWRSCRRHLRNTDASQKRAPRARGEPRASAEWGARSPGEAVSFRDICRQLLSNRVSLPHRHRCSPSTASASGTKRNFVRRRQVTDRDSAMRSPPGAGGTCWTCGQPARPRQPRPGPLIQPLLPSRPLLQRLEELRCRTFGPALFALGNTE